MNHTNTPVEDISDALGLSLNGTKAILVSRITEHFSEFPRFKEDVRFSALKFEREQRGRKRAGQDQDATATEPPTQRRRLSPPVHENFQSSVASSSRVQLEHLQHSLNPLQPIASNFINTFALGSSYNYRSI
jgi:hypothetical protein